MGREDSEDDSSDFSPRSSSSSHNTSFLHICSDVATSTALPVPTQSESGINTAASGTSTEAASVRPSVPERRKRTTVSTIEVDLSAQHADVLAVQSGVAAEFVGNRPDQPRAMGMTSNSPHRAATSLVELSESVASQYGVCTVEAEYESAGSTDTVELDQETEQVIAQHGSRNASNASSRASSVTRYSGGSEADASGDDGGPSHRPSSLARKAGPRVHGAAARSLASAWRKGSPTWAAGRRGLDPLDTKMEVSSTLAPAPSPNEGARCASAGRARARQGEEAGKVWGLGLGA
jgi:hypothetical protein